MSFQCRLDIPNLRDNFPVTKCYGRIHNEDIRAHEDNRKHFAHLAWY